MFQDQTLRYMLENYNNMFLGCPRKESQGLSHCIHQKEGKTSSAARAGPDQGIRHLCGDGTLV